MNLKQSKTNIFYSTKNNYTDLINNSLDYRAPTCATFRDVAGSCVAWWCSRLQQIAARSLNKSDLIQNYC